MADNEELTQWVNTHNDALTQWINTRKATTEVVLCLIEDLAPIIGYNEATRLINIISEAQRSDEK